MDRSRLCFVFLGGGVWLGAVACNTVAGLDGLTFDSGSFGGEGGTGAGVGGSGGDGCPAGKGDCDGNPGNGCETDTTSNANHCGGCNEDCPDGVNGAVSCEDSACVIACDARFGDCDDDVATGCEEALEKNIDHCGGCDQACETEFCADGLCDPLTLASGLVAPQGITAVGDTLYVCEFSAGQVSSVPKDGGTAIPVMTGLTSCAGIATDGTTLYVADYVGNAVLKFEIGGADVQNTVYSGGGFHGVAVAGDELYLTDHDAKLVVLGTVDGATPPTTIVGPSFLDRPTSVALDGANFFVADYGTGEVLSGTAAGDEPTVLSDSNTNPWYVTFDADYVYWTNGGGGDTTLSEVLRLPKDGSTGPQQLAKNLPNPSGIHVDDTHVYVVLNGAGTVTRLPKFAD